MRKSIYKKEKKGGGFRPRGDRIEAVRQVARSFQSREVKKLERELWSIKSGLAARKETKNSVEIVLMFVGNTEIDVTTPTPRSGDQSD